MTTEPHWALCYHSNSFSPRARRWYYVARLIKTDGLWFQLYRHPESTKLSARSLPETRKRAAEHGVKLLPGVYRNAPSPRIGDVMERVL